MITAKNNQIRHPGTVGLSFFVVTILGLPCIPGSALGQEQGGTVTVDVARCLELDAPEARLACFGAQVDEVLEERSPAVPEATSEAVETVEADPATAQRQEAAGRAAAAPVAEPARDSEPESGEFFGTIVDIRERLPNAYVIRLDNGQIWEQTEPKRYPLRPGLEVRIYPTRWGSRYRLTGIDTGGNIQVRRVE